MRIPCPWCGSRAVDEFVYGGDASVTRPAVTETNAEKWLDYLYARQNPKGAHREFWQHEKGCHHWLVVERDTVTNEIRSVHFADEAGS